MDTSTFFNTFTGEIQELTMYTDEHFKLYISIFIGLQVITIIMFRLNNDNLIYKFKKQIVKFMYSISVIFILVFSIESIVFTKNKYFYIISILMINYLIVMGIRLRNNINK
ncbi:hypothetical protein CBC_0887 [Clostridium botulinum C str. Eklund]|nr:hypothetical protein CBC_0887 [Clostridium botulinum C str. Eklund]NEZ49087.1 hypothetical protein [Clostridium botulinum]